MKTAISINVPDPDLLMRIQQRWQIKPIKWPWFPSPCKVRILMYADFGNAYDNGPFDGLKHVIATLSADPYFWVNFSVAKANRGTDPSADPSLQNKTLDQIDWTQYDQVWLFGYYGGTSVLSQAEVNAVRVFMDAGGGVLITGDHDSLGAAIGSAIPRAGRMRAWQPGVDAPSASGTDRHSTLREGHEPGWQFNDQSDDVPQIIRFRTYPVFGFPWFHHWHWQRRRPHPVLCGPDGPIDVLPDHMHEGVITIPSSLPASEWPSSPGGFQPKPEVIAWAKIEQTGLDKSSMEFPVLGAYEGHAAGVGRIVADATWHHWFDINLIGENGAVAGDSAGFDATPSGQAALKKIEAYFLNVAIWLAPPSKQTCMRNRLCWGALWHDPLVMMSPKLPIQVLGGFAIDALGKYAPQCTVYGLIWASLAPSFKLRLSQMHDGGLPLPPLIEEHIIGAALQSMLVHAERIGRIPLEASEREMDSVVNAAFQGAAARGLQDLVAMAQQSAKAIEELASLAREDRDANGGRPTPGKRSTS